MSSTTQPRLYFGYGSNLWLQQMRMRCPSSPYRGIASLKGWKWIINTRGYANVVETGSDESDVVWGMVYELDSEDEVALDGNEGVPYAYEKEMITCEFWDEKSQGHEETVTKGEMSKMLLYVDRKRTEDAEPKKEYVHRMNMGIADAIKMGVPESYVKEVLRKFIPDEKGDEEIQELAKKQAKKFEDESGVIP
jgi:gamma-glutamylcyclotransferase